MNQNGFQNPMTQETDMQIYQDPKTCYPQPEREEKNAAKQQNAQNYQRHGFPAPTAAKQFQPWPQPWASIWPEDAMWKVIAEEC